MASLLLFALQLLAIVGCVLMAGVFLAFSTFIMNALARLKPSQGMAVMQAINITVINPLFMTVFLGTGITCLLLVIYALFHWQQPGVAMLLMGSQLYLIGTLVVSIAFNIPLNEALAKVEPDSVAGESFWATYLANWTAWNHLRTITSVAATIAFSLALRQVITR
jgi:uncharacterized membrane protein